MATIFEFSDILKSKIESKNSAHLYILTYHEQLQPFDEIQSIIKNKLTGSDTFENPDFLTITRDIKEEEKEYRIQSDSFKKYFDFIKYRPFVLSKKVAIIKDAHLISETLCNKLLKTFEESPEYLITILCMPHQYTLLSTIESRAIAIRLTAPQNSNPKSDEINELNLVQLSAYIKKKPDEEIKFIKNQINYILNMRPLDYNEIDKLLISLKNYEIHKNFNGPINSRLAMLMP